MRTVFILGNGLRNNPALVKRIESMGVPCLITWQAADLLPEDSPVFCGRPGVLGQRAANIIQQKVNRLIVVGARLDNEQIAHNLAGFAPHANKTIFDVDPAELAKFPDTWSKVRLDLTDDSPFLSVERNLTWLAKCKDLYNKFRYELDGEDCKDVNPYSFVCELSNACKEGDILVPGSSGTQSCAFFQAFKVKRNQRILCCNTIGAMGMEPMAIGAALASRRRVIVVTGDGGFVQTMGELEVVRRMNLPIHYFVFSNHGYGSISTMQDNRFGGFRVGSTPESGLTLPSLEKVSMLYDMPYFEMKTNSDLSAMKKIIANNKATLTSVTSSLDFRYAMKVESSIKDGVFIPDDMADMSPKIDWKDLL